MTEAIANLGFDQDSFETFLSSVSQPQWLVEKRREAWSHFQSMPWPTRSDEEWIRTDIRLFNLDRFPLPARDSVEPSVSTNSVESVALLAKGVELAGSSMSVDSHPASSWIGDKWRDQGVVFGNLRDLSSSHESLIRPYLMQRAFDPTHDRFAALHAACWSGGHFLYVPRGVVVDEPFHLVSSVSDGGTDLGHTLVILEEGAEATVLEENAGLGEHDSGLHCGGQELLVGTGANLRYVHLQHWGDRTWHFAQQKAILDRDATIQWTIGALGSRLSKVNQQVELAGEGANSQVNGVLFTQDKQHLSYHTLQHHVAPHCQSDFLYKSALQDRSRTVWRGMIKCDPDAQKTDGYQRNDNLLLSSHARADSIPGLEIEADDVRCTHGSTSGKVNEELIFYACCRGFTRKEAVRMIVTGFFQQIFDRITIDSVREALASAIARRVREYD